MTAATQDRQTKGRDGQGFEFQAALNTTIYGGTIVCLNASGLAVPGATSTALKAVGVAQSNVVNGATGTDRVKVYRGTYLFNNSTAGDAITNAHYGQDCFIVDDNTVALTNGGSTRSIAGKVRGVEAGGVWVEF